MARTEIPAKPIGTEIGRSHLRPEGRRTAEVSTQTDHHEQLGLDRPVLRIDISRLLGSLGLRIGYLAGNLLQISEDLVGPTHDKYRLTAPLGDHLLPRLALADIYPYRRTGSLGLGTREPRSPKRDRSTPRPCRPPHRSGGHTEPTPACIHPVLADR